MSKRESSKTNNNDDDDNNESIKDEQVRKDVQVLSARLYDLKERFMQTIHKINNDSNGFDNQISDEGEQTSTKDEEEEDDDNSSSDDSDDEEHSDKSKSLIKSILQRKATQHEYIKYILQYPKIVKYLTDENPNCTSIPRRYLEPFIKDHVDKNLNGKIYDQVHRQIHDIRRIYLKNCE